MSVTHVTGNQTIDYTRARTVYMRVRVTSVTRHVHTTSFSRHFTAMVAPCCALDSASAEYSSAHGRAISVAVASVLGCGEMLPTALPTKMLVPRHIIAYVCCVGSARHAHGALGRAGFQQTYLEEHAT
jgi:hypothetical protein